MFKLKPFQNSETTEHWKIGKELFTAKVITTMTKVLVYHPKGNLIAQAGCKYAKDFNYDELIKIARKESNVSNMEVA